MMAEAIGAIYGLKERYQRSVATAASRINSRNAAVYWESERDVEYVATFLKRRRDVEGDTSPELAKWIGAFDADPCEAALEFWFEARKGIDESLRDFL
jgi:glyceraldehyde-3-phosphate dehydrogenase (ferredoxin)